MFSSTGASLLRTLFLGIAYPMGRMDWTYKPPPNEKTPLVLEVFNPTFWVMIEMSLGACAANLPPLAPVLGKMGFGDFVSKVHRGMTALTSKSRSTKASHRSKKSSGSDSSNSHGEGDSRPSYAGPRHWNSDEHLFRENSHGSTLRPSDSSLEAARHGNFPFEEKRYGYSNV